MDDVSQLQMFGLPEEAMGPVGAAAADPGLEELGARIPANVFLGTSSWSFPGWEGLVYDRPASETVLARRGLRAYAKHPLFRSVGIDRTYYATVEAEVFRSYADAVPPGFRFLVKAHQDVTVPWFGERAGKRAGENPRFLDADYATDAVVAPIVQGLGTKAGPLVLQFSPMNLAHLGGPGGFARRLRRFLLALPSGPLYACELRNRELLTSEYAAALRDAGAVHCLNAHPSMPTVGEQAQRLGDAFTAAPAVVIRWMLARPLDYQAAKGRYAPFDRIVDPDPGSREEIAGLLRQERRPAYAIVNNKAEGSSPLSVRALAERLVTS